MSDTASTTPEANSSGRRGVGVTPDDLYSPSWRAHWKQLGVYTDATLWSTLVDSAAAHPTTPAIIAPSAAAPHPTDMVELTYSELLTYAEEVSQCLWDAGVRAGDAVVLYCPNTVEFLGVLFGSARLGAIPVHALPAHGTRELMHFLQASNAPLVACVQQFGTTRPATTAADAVDQLGSALGDGPGVFLIPAPAAITGSPAATVTVEPAGVNAEELALIQLSGGTTGVPKLIGRSHADYLYSVRTSVDICAIGPHTRMLVLLPAAHNFTMSSPGILGVIHAGGTLVFAPDPSPTTAFALIERYRITIASLVPPLAMLWLSAAAHNTHDISSLEVLQVGGAKFADTAAAQVRSALGCTLQQVFGMAEGLVNYTRLDDPEDIITHSQGRPMSDYDEVEILDEDGHPVAPGESGYLWTRGPYTIHSYLGGVSASSFDERGFYCSGDIVRQLPSGHLVVEGRAKEQINRAGEKISCEEVENALLQLPGVRDALVVGIADELVGEKICAVIIPHDPHNEQLSAQFERAHVREQLTALGLATFKLPDCVWVREEFPTTSVGKASRATTRKLLQQHADIA